MEYRVLNTEEAVNQAIAAGLKLPNTTDFYGEKYYKTKNENGVGWKDQRTLGLSASKFLKITTIPHARVVDVGCGYGAVPIEALKNNASDVTAIEIEEDHLKILGNIRDIPKAYVK